MRRLRVTTVAALLLAWSAPPASAQSVELVERSTPGWVLTPTVALGITFDSNPVLTAQGDPAPNDLLTRARPGLDLSFNGRHTTLSGAYRGNLLRYRTLTEYDTYDQGGSLQLRHRPSRRVDLFARSSLVISPATDILELAGVPFFRAGTRQVSAEAGTSVAAGRHVTLSGAYRFQTVDFDVANPEIAALLRGGEAHGLSLGLTRQLSTRVKVGASYGYQRASYGATEGGFDIQNAEATIAVQLRPTVDLDAGAGFSRLVLPEDGVRTGPAGRVALNKRTAHAQFSVSASRSFIPAFGFGGSVMNQDLSAAVQVPFARRRGTARAAFSWRGSEPVLEQELALTSVWLQTSVGYALQRWLRVEAFYNGAFQDTVVVGGRVDRHRVGVLFSTSAPMRIQ